MRHLAYISLTLLISFSLALSSFAAKKEKVDLTQLQPTEAAQDLLKRNDFNNDGKLERKEVNLSFYIHQFRKVDENNDKFLDEKELVAMYERLQQRQEVSQ